MGHIRNNALGALSRVTIGAEDAMAKAEKCETCIQAKSTAKISRTPMPRASEVLEKVHSDICGPISPGTFGRKKYFVSFIDDYSRYADVRLLGTRDDLYNEFSGWLDEEQQ